ncbi:MULTISPECIES: 5-methylcytosine restriction system specificity protein McrC [Elizabethkingia]|uniref:Restriction endonuclease n=1 Tax=Elizabethkingia meningoseptica TaxID=238 RepID=A0A1T3EZS1_ELIME|nr:MULTISPECIES: restriction endonuclease [Elizabethkingia]AQX10943.1 restriction endonuclease [Elizabethkingia meningoseptica]MBG0512261.1 restriction endonuclease [Elizabethkingia meningoseptica]MDE5436037.1 McrC family protein [Elizabethkingia meningoseptica]MDE5480454.1 McrC family protein [Elizabethkingia meningoseptica]MDE5538356.1 McrC family protein [Elizabethkingia meningoseptica]
MGIRLYEHQSFSFHAGDQEEILRSLASWTVPSPFFEKLESLKTKAFNNSSNRFVVDKKESTFQVKADYCIGMDWLGSTEEYIYVEPKINKATARIFDDATNNENEEESLTNDDQKSPELLELDYLKMLFQVTAIKESSLEANNLLQIDWTAKHIKIEQKDDKLTPFLVIQFLQSLKSIVKKGLKKNYYKTTENLSNKVKGKILIGSHIKQNVFKNKLTNTYCEYQIFGENHVENRFLKKVLHFVITYVENHKLLFDHNYVILQQAISYCRPAFEQISDICTDTEIKSTKKNPFYKDYEDALEMGCYILKRFAYNISNATTQSITTPPFWIDMPRLFELYVYSKMIEHNSEYKKEIHYQFSTYGNALDILVAKPNHQMVIDAKYKLIYGGGHLHQDIRQVAGYARLNKVRKQLNVTDDSTIDCLIIYPDMENGIEKLTLETIMENRSPITAYHKVYKLGVKLPTIQNDRKSNVDYKYYKGE